MFRNIFRSRKYFVEILPIDYKSYDQSSDFHFILPFNKNLNSMMIGESITYIIYLSLRHAKKYSILFCRNTTTWIWLCETVRGAKKYDINWASKSSSKCILNHVNQMISSIFMYIIQNWPPSYDCKFNNKFNSLA